MFDNQDNQVITTTDQAALPKQVPSSAQDIFADTQPTSNQPVYQPIAEKPAVFSQNSKIDAVQPGDLIAQEEAEGKKRIFVGVVSSFVGIIVLSVVGYFGYGYYSDNRSVSSTGVTPKQENAQITEEKQKSDNAPQSTDQASVQTQEVQTDTNNQETVLTADSDGDGMIDSEESAIGTNKNQVDSDSDSLTDREEVKVYKTNPMIMDSDGDGYGDGDEVKAGYNPNGAGKLMEVKQ